jgi:hypothetical protein
VGALVSLWHLLGLYETGVFATGLVVEDVASPIYSMGPETTARRALKAMFDRRIRRVFIDDTAGFVWDRGMIDRLFSPSALKDAASRPTRDFLGLPLSEFQRMYASEVKPRTKLKEAARMLGEKRGACLICDGKVVTPWDVVIKPWKSKTLKIT